jgi:predicted nucleic-acid-binding protein
MLGVDTNVLVRFLVRDDEVQFEKARKLIKREIAAGRRVFVSQLVLLETEWVLRSRYSLPKNLIIEAISGLLDATDVRFEDEPAIEEALFIWKDTTADFADCLIGWMHPKPTTWMRLYTSDGNPVRCEGSFWPSCRGFISAPR